MLNIFKSKEEAAPDWLPELIETKERWFNFLNKLEEKLEELCTAAIPALETTYREDDDLYKRTYDSLASSIRGQIETVRKKAYETYDLKIIDFLNALKEKVSNTSSHYSLLHDFRTDCSDRYNQQFDTKLNYWIDKINATKAEDFEQQYQDILDEYQEIKNNFTCKQCRGSIPINKIYFITTYLSCPQCQTQNTYEPSTKTKMLEQVGRSLAEQRTALMLLDYSNATEMERVYYHQMHELKLSKIQEKDKKIIAQIDKEIDTIEKQRQAVIQDAPLFYEKYLRAMFNEWNKIVPDLAIENEKFYERMIVDFRKSI